MPRGQRRKPQATAEEAQQHVDAAVSTGGSNSEATAKKHFGEILRLELKLAGVRGDLAAAWKAAESDGIDKKPFKAAMKLLNSDPATADAYVRSFTQYTTQLGLFERIADWKSAEEMEANKASADVAERENARPQSGNASAEPKSGGTEDAIYAQGFQAGEEDAPRNEHGYHGEQAETWQRGWHAGAMKRVDATNSEMAGA